MSQARYNVVYRGSLVSGFTVDQVKENFIKKFSLSEEKLDAILAKNRFIFKRGIDKETGEKYQRVFRAIGMETELELIEESLEAPAKVIEVAAEAANQEPPTDQAPHEQTEPASPLLNNHVKWRLLLTEAVASTLKSGSSIFFYRSSHWAFTQPGRKYVTNATFTETPKLRGAALSISRAP